MGASDSDENLPNDRAADAKSASQTPAKTMPANDMPANDMLAADPFSTGDPFDGPRLSPMATPQERKALLGELRGLIQSGEYQVDPEIVAVAVMREGRWEPRET